MTDDTSDTPPPPPSVAWHVHQAASAAETTTTTIASEDASRAATTDPSKTTIRSVHATNNNNNNNTATMDATPQQQPHIATPRAATRSSSGSGGMFMGGFKDSMDTTSSVGSRQSHHHPPLQPPTIATTTSSGGGGGRNNNKRQPPAQVTFDALAHVGTVRRPQPAEGDCEDSVAEMDYMSEASNVSAMEDVPTPTSEPAAVEKTTDTARGGEEFIRPIGIPVRKSQLHPTPASSSVPHNASVVPPGPFHASSLRKTPALVVAAAAPQSPQLGVPHDPAASTQPPHNSISNNSGGSSSAARNTDEPTTTNTAAATTAAALSNNAPPSDENEHRPLYLPKFQTVQSCMWTASHAANCPSEDRSASLVNLLLQPLPPNFDSETQLPPLVPDYKTLIRLNLWAVIDGHGGGCVATYGSEVLLPHIAANVSRALGCAIVDRGVCTVNGQLRDANALDLDGLIQNSSDHRSQYGNPNSIHYRSPFEKSDTNNTNNEEPEEALSQDDHGDNAVTAGERHQLTASLVAAAAEDHKAAAAVAQDISTDASRAGSLSPEPKQHPTGVNASVSSVKTSVKTAASPANREEVLGTHSPAEVSAITRAITESFLAVDEGWINSIDPVATHQTSCQSNGRWNSGACALVVFTVQRLDWTSVSEPDREKEFPDREKSRRNTSQNRAAARRRMQDYARRTSKVAASSMSTVSSTSSLTTEEAVHASGIESEITETEEDEHPNSNENVRKREAASRPRHAVREKQSLISPPGGCSCHCYKPHGAMIYTAHVGDCRAVMLGCAPPRTIKVGDFSSHPDTTDDESSHHSSDETECLSSSDHDADSSEEEDIGGGRSTATTAASSAAPYMNFPRRVVRQRNRRRDHDDAAGPYIALPPLDVNDEQQTVEFDFETDIARREARRTGKEPSDSSTATDDSLDSVPLVQLSTGTRPIDLTTDHSAYNPAEVTAVLRRCNNAPRAISAGVGGGIKRVAGSLAVTRALGDAYLKTPLLSFLPYKSHAPYITARPEVNCRPLVKEGDKVLLLATDGVWERASGEDVLRWVRNFYEERIAEAERRKNRRMNHVNNDRSQSSNDDSNSFEPVPCSKNFQQEGSERDLFEKNDPVVEPSNSSRKRDMTSSPVGAALVAAKRRKRSRQHRISYNVADVIVRRVLNKVRRARNISSLQALMSLPQGRARRSKHDDVTASVVDLSAFVS